VPSSRPALGQLRTAARSRAAASAPDAPAPAGPSRAGGDESAPPEAGGAGLDRDALTVAWADVILPQLSPRARALFQGGRFTSAAGTECTFAVHNEAQRDQCERKRSEVEAAIGEHFSSTVRLHVVVDDTGVPAAPAAPAPIPTQVAPGGQDAADMDLDELDGGAAPDTESIAAARVLDAFPGATEVRS
jgi:hypothetical protein